MSAETISSPDGGRKTGARSPQTRNRRQEKTGPSVVDDQARGHAGTTILRADLDHVRRPGDREDIEQDPVLLVLRVRLEADGVDWQDLSALQERVPTRDQRGLRDVELLERVRIRSAADESRQLGELTQPVEATSDDPINVVLRGLADQTAPCTLSGPCSHDFSIANGRSS
jgi:hypothetical protein